MCGIAGIIGRRPVNRETVQQMMDRLAHRGPDGERMWADASGQVVLGHRRLAIIDPTPAGMQPMISASGDLTLTFNGEIYNYIELAQRLKADGYEFRSASDSEVLLAAYETWGEAGLKELNGMFAFALYDARNEKLVCARDRFGEKPFLYAEGPDFFAFASEYKALLMLAGVSADVDQVRLLRFLHQPRVGLDDDRQSVFAGVKQLLPGECLVVDTRSLETRVSRYWTLEKHAEYGAMSEPDATARFCDLLAESVAIRMRSDVPVGSCLSGGLDSGSIVCLNRRHLGEGKPYHVFTGRFPGAAADESERADEVVRATAVTSHMTDPTPEGFLDELAEFVWYNELPVGSSSQFAQWCVFRLAKDNGVTVLLDGQGADEVLGGYEQYFVPYLKSVDAERRRAEEPVIRERYPKALLSPRQEWTSRLPTGLRHLLGNTFRRGSDFLFGLTPELAAKVAKLHASEERHDLDPLAGALYEDSFHAHLPTLLRYGDRNSMAHSREVRLPFCDHRVAELALSLPAPYLMGGAQTKRILRNAMKGILPETTRTRWNKQGFLPPQDAWFANGLMDWARETVSSRTFAERGIWNAPWWQGVVERIDRGEGHLAWPLWKPLIGEAWYADFVGRLETEAKLPPLVEQPGDG